MYTTVVGIKYVAIDLDLLVENAGSTKVQVSKL